VACHINAPQRRSACAGPAFSRFAALAGLRRNQRMRRPRQRQSAHADSSKGFTEETLRPRARSHSRELDLTEPALGGSHPPGKESS
jgi:hypothetical protein